MNRRALKNWFFSVVAAGAISARASTMTPLENSSFEQEAPDSYNAAMSWRLNTPDDHGDAYGSAAREGWRARTGQFAATIRGTWANAGDYGGWWQEREGRGSHSYRAAAWFYTDAGWTAASQELKLEFWNWDRSQLINAAIVPLTELGENWSQREIAAVAPEGTEWVRIVIHVSGAGPVGALQIDDVELVEQP